MPCNVAAIHFACNSTSYLVQKQDKLLFETHSSSLGSMVDWDEWQSLTNYILTLPHLISINGGRWEYSSSVIDTIRFPLDFRDLMVALVLHIPNLWLRGYSLFFPLYLIRVILSSCNLYLVESAWMQQDKFEYTYLYVHLLGILWSSFSSLFPFVIGFP